jgi:hypothetical protein
MGIHLTHDLAGPLTPHLTPSQLHARTNYLVDHYLSLDYLTQRLEDLPSQFQTPTPRPWAAIHWQAITPDQVIGIKPEVFTSLLAGIINTEAPIRGYTPGQPTIFRTFLPSDGSIRWGTAQPGG